MLFLLLSATWKTRGRLLIAQGRHEVDFPQDNGMRFRSDNLPLHENGMQIHAYNGDKEIYSKTYYSIGGGFIVDEEHFGKDSVNEVSVPYPFHSAQEMLQHCKDTGLSVSGMVMQNELALHSRQEIEDYFANIWQNHARLYRSRHEYRRCAAWPAASAASCICPAPHAGVQRQALQRPDERG
ncbi:L-serine dehydratase 1 [Cedecea neteri]|uniref:L-serine ammonia-lyase n=1 Tax=Cedecea neteri TaxID=158822 RepID=A0A2X3JCP5_9ENTR|nr:L-serine dehydratase 1 [Cedecea neteri]